MDIAKRIAQYVLDTNFDNLPEAATLSVKRSYLDSLGVMIAGSTTETVETYIKFLTSNELSGKSKIDIGVIQISLPILDAACLYGIMLHSLDYDDTGAFTQGHPSSTLFPVIYALSEEFPISGKDIIAAYTVGVEILSRLSKSMPMMHTKGWHPTGTIGTIAATVTAAKLLKLDRNQIINAVGIACSSASGLVQNFGSMTKPLHAGNAVYNGLKAAFLAKSGYTSNIEAIDGNLGFVQTYFKDIDKLKEYFLNLNDNIVIVNPGINIKRHASCSLTHRSIDGVLKIVENNRIIAKDIKLIECHSSPRAMKVLFYSNPQTELEAKFSMHYVLAAAVVYRDLSPKQFSKEKISNKLVQELIHSIRFKIHDDWVDGDDWRADKIILTTNDGMVYEELVQFPKGNVAIPLTWDEIAEKFKSCCTGILNEELIQSQIDWVQNLEFQNNR